jgi:hypothetical protein
MGQDDGLVIAGEQERPDVFPPGRREQRAVAVVEDAALEHPAVEAFADDGGEPGPVGALDPAVVIALLDHPDCESHRIAAGHDRRVRGEVVLGLIERTLRDLAADENGAHNWRPLADVMAGSMSYLWLIRDIYGGGKPCGIDIEAYITAVWESSAALIESMTRPPGIRAHQPVS